MRMLRVLARVGALAAAGLATVLPARADPPLAGAMIAIDTHGQPICNTREALRDYLVATIRHDRLVPTFSNKVCTIAPYGTRVTVLQDLSPFGSRLHVVRVLAATPLQKVEGFTYSVGLYDPRRFQRFNSLGEYFPAVL